MPKSKIQDYIFYKITCLDNSCELCYVGSTVNWKARSHAHKNNCTNENSRVYNYKVYKTIRDNGGWVNFKMIEIGKAEQLSLRQAQKIEDDYRIELKANMNSIRCYVTEEQQREHNKEYDKQRYKNNIEYNKQKNNKYRTNNRDKLKQKAQEYRTNNKDRIKANASQKITCECGCEVRRDHLPVHKKTKKHIKLMSIKDVSVVT